MFGEWQTEEWTPPAAQNGRVPRNEHGNVEVPPFAKALPVGTVHLRMAGVVAVVRQLGIDFAPALVGFEMQGGRMLPKLDGVVVCVVSGCWKGCQWVAAMLLLAPGVVQGITQLLH
jgi:xeroderma pigmentosum group C-complementing protein